MLIHKKLGKHLALTTAIAGALFSGYGGMNAYAGTCTGGAGVFNCSGAANNLTDVEQNLSSNTTLTVTTSPGFGLDVNAANSDAMTLRILGGGGALNFTDNNNSIITGSDQGLIIFNNGISSITVNTAATITGTNEDGVLIQNSVGGTDTNTTFSGDIVGAINGLTAVNNGTGNTTVTTGGTVTGNDNFGIAVVNTFSAKNIDLITSNSVVGKNFGAGSSRQQAVDCFIALGIGAIVAVSFGAIYKRNAINSALPIMEYPEGTVLASTGDELEIDLESGIIKNLTNGKTFQAKPFSDVQLQIYKAGNLFSFARKK